MDTFEPIDLFDEGTVPGAAAAGGSDGAKPAAGAKPDAANTPAEGPAPEEALPADAAARDAAEETAPAADTEAPADGACAQPEPAARPEDGLRADIDALKAMAETTSARLEELSRLFDKRILYAEHEEKIVDQMHKELQKYKEDLYAQLVRPILTDIIEVRDSIMRVAAAYAAKPEGEQDVPNKTFADYSFDLQDILEKNNVEIYRSAAGGEFLPVKQRAVKKIPTPDQTLHGKIAESFSCGYNYLGRTISAEKVALYFYEEPLEQ